MEKRRFAVTRDLMDRAAVAFGLRGSCADGESDHHQLPPSPPHKHIRRPDAVKTTDYLALDPQQLRLTRLPKKLP
jgi:hypothetical protein